MKKGKFLPARVASIRVILLEMQGSIPISRPYAEPNELVCARSESSSLMSYRAQWRCSLWCTASPSRPGVVSHLVPLHGITT